MDRQSIQGGVFLCLDPIGIMTPHTASSLEQVLKEVWNEQVFKKAFDLEVQGSLNDMRQQAQRFYVDRPTVTTGWIGGSPYHVDMSPKAVHARKARQDQMVRQLAAKKRGNKPSYRQRQKNGRAGRK